MNDRLVVVLSARLGAVLPAAAVRRVREGAVLRADPELPTALRDVFAADGTGDDGVLLTSGIATAEAARWVAAGAEVVRTPEPRGAALLDAVAVMDRLRSPGGCPWDAEQTHTSLLPYLVEEAYELYEAVEDGDRAALREELGDVLLQVLFHARLAAEWDFDIDAVAEDLVAKLVGRHPHVFGGTECVMTASDQEVRWEELKHAEKRRESSVDGVAGGQPAAALAAKLVSRTVRAGLPADLLPAGAEVGAALFGLAAAVTLEGEDPEGALRAAARRFAVDVRAAERSAREAGLDSAALTPQQWRAHWPVNSVPPAPRSTHERP